MYVDIAGCSFFGTFLAEYLATGLGGTFSCRFREDLSFLVIGLFDPTMRGSSLGRTARVDLEVCGEGITKSSLDFDGVKAVRSMVKS